MPKDGEMIHMLQHRDSKQFYYPEDRKTYKSTMVHVMARFVAGKGFEYVGPYTGDMPEPDQPDWNNLGRPDILKLAKRKYPKLKLDPKMRVTEMRQAVLDHEQEIFQQSYLTGEGEE